MGKNIYAIPWFSDIKVLYYRRDIFDKLGIDYNDLENRGTFISVCEKLKRRNVVKMYPMSLSGQKETILIHDLAPWIWALSEYKKAECPLPAKCPLPDDFLSSMKDNVNEIIENYKCETDFNIKMDTNNGLISAGSEGMALTWMDAVYEGVPVTQRVGKPVEIQGIWYNALDFAGEMD